MLHILADLDSKNINVSESLQHKNKAQKKKPQFESWGSKNQFRFLKYLIAKLTHIFGKF